MIRRLVSGQTIFHYQPSACSRKQRPPEKGAALARESWNARGPPAPKREKWQSTECSQLVFRGTIR